jgi:hypothetical protein
MQYSLLQNSLASQWSNDSQRYTQYTLEVFETIQSCGIYTEDKGCFHRLVIERAVTEYVYACFISS